MTTSRKLTKKRFELVFDIFRDKKLIEKLEKQPNKADYIRGLIEEDIKKNSTLY